ncbi:MAG TPA: ABC transporter ATP-binding protein [Pyrinomonadaceae bacterium]|jgi:putative ABC transport system ATP-binding protein|nr:ABC transporter ATP-binding protein [Pyrinomonadaceae bacterium]
MISLSGVSKRVNSGEENLTILDQVSFDIPRGQFVALIGPSGSGKSTLLGLIAGLDTPSEGKIIVDNKDITKLSDSELSRYRSQKIGFIFQSFHLIPSLTAFENVLIPMEIAGVKNPEDRAHLLLETVGLTKRKHHYPSQLSGGEQQRVAIARAFANRPPILLADEPTGNLDSKNGHKIMDLMQQLHNDSEVTLILVTHEQELAMRAQRRIYLNDGRIVEDSLIK